MVTSHVNHNNAKMHRSTSDLIPEYSENDRKFLSERRGSLIILTITILIIVVIVITGICAAILLEKHESQIIILTLIAILILVGIVSFVFLEFQRRQAARNRDMAAADLVQQIYEQQQREGQLAQNKTSTWALTEPWRYSQRSTLKV